MAKTTPKRPEGSACPQCSGAGHVAVQTADGRRVVVLCGGSVCQGRLEDRVVERVTHALEVALARQAARDSVDLILGDAASVRRIVAETMRHLPPELTRSAKR